jgi:hypothetical protein
MSFGVTNSFLEEFDFMFHQMLRQRGSQLMGMVQEEQVMGATKYLRQASVGDAHFVTDVGGPTEYTTIKYDKRKLEPKPFECPIMLDKYDMVMQGTPDVGQLAQEASDSCGVLIDKIILKGIYGPAATAASGNVVLPTTQNIAYNSNDLLPVATNLDYPAAIRNGLNTSKVATAVQMLRSKFNNAPLICIASNYALSTLRADPRAANSLFNASGPALSIGQNNPYGGCDAFIPSEQVEKNGLAAGNYREYAYIYALDQIRLGSSMPLTMDYGKNAERGLNDVIIYRGMYDCVRMQEESVVRIEIAYSSAT